ncbi:MAG: glycosyltransferase family 2 protein, partial [Patescibacteria group bacterium]
MKVYVVILSYNGKKDTCACLKTLKQSEQSAFDLEVVVVDNASTDDTIQTIRQEYPEVTILVNHDNLGFAEGNNIGIRFALKHNADFIFILNNDTLLAKNTISCLVEFALKEKRGGIFGPKIYFSPHAETHKKRYKNHELGSVIWYAGGELDWKNVYASHKGVDEVDKGQY